MLMVSLLLLAPLLLSSMLLLSTLLFMMFLQVLASLFFLVALLLLLCLCTVVGVLAGRPCWGVCCHSLVNTVAGVPLDRSRDSVVAAVPSAVDVPSSTCVSKIYGSPVADGPDVVGVPAAVDSLL